MQVDAPHQGERQRQNERDAENCEQTAHHASEPSNGCAGIIAAMQAVVIRGHGGYEKLERTELSPPSRRSGEALVRVRAVALNHLDVWVRRGVPGHTFPLPLVPGSEVSGVIEEIDAGTEWKPGDEVIVAPGFSCGVCEACLSGNDPLCRQYGIFGENADGGLRELMPVPLRNLLRKPANLSFAEAAAVPLDMLTAWHMLIERAKLRPGETVLVQAGGSGLGTAAIQIAKMWGATVVTTAGSPAKAARAKELGAELAIHYRETDFVAEVRNFTSKRGVDVVVEHVGGETFEQSLKALARGGRLVTCGATTGADVSINLRVVFFKLISILGSTMGSLAELHTIMKHVSAGRLKPVVDRVLDFADVAEGHRVLESREAFGKVVIRIEN
jgi:NADPH:quinone reductase-like Zn-dependent oxidoreductase